MSTTAALPRIAIVHDDLARAGGAERVALFMTETFPDAPIYTSVYLPTKTYDEFRSKLVRTLSGSRLIKDERRFKQLFLWWMIGFRQLDLQEYDFVLSSTTFGAKHIRPSAQARHVCYCYAPFRLVWKPESYSADSLPLNKSLQGFMQAPLSVVRRIDYQATQRLPVIATSCRNMQDEIQKVYGRESTVINPPIRLEDYRVSPSEGGYYLTVGRLIYHKRIDLVIKACKQLRKKLIVVGEGPERKKLEELGDTDIQFTGLVSDQRLRDLYSSAKALLFPSFEDYGIVPLESQASGRPVIALGRGGVLETVADGETGIFFAEQTVESIVDAMERFESLEFDPYFIRGTMARFDLPFFQEKLRNLVLGTDGK
jgi:glycosyltransferase involved in cell wall biosynthesis